MEAPAGTDPLYRRYGGYIHPLKSPSGKILTTFSLLIITIIMGSGIPGTLNI